MTESSLYERLGGAFAIAAVIDHFSDALMPTPSSGRLRKTRHSRRGTRRASIDYRASSSCEPSGFARSPAGRSELFSH